MTEKILPHPVAALPRPGAWGRFCGCMMRFDHRNMANRRMRRLYPPVCGCGVRENICRTIEEQYNKHDYLLREEGVDKQ